MERQVFLAIDPGKTTGYCLGCKADGKLYLVVTQRLDSELDLYRTLRALAQEGPSKIPPVHVICETFTFRNSGRTGLDFSPAHMIGIVNLGEQIWKYPLHWQNPDVQGKKAYWSNVKLKDYGIYRPGEAYHHAMSATKHGMYWIRFKAGFPLIWEDDLEIEIVEEDWMVKTYFPYLPRIFSNK